MLQAFQLFVADTFRQLTEQKDTEEQQKNEKLLATIRKEKVFKRKHQTEAFNKALEIFVKDKLSVLRVETIDHNLQTVAEYRTKNTETKTSNCYTSAASFLRLSEGETVHFGG